MDRVHCGSDRPLVGDWVHGEKGSGGGLGFGGDGAAGGVRMDRAASQHHRALRGPQRTVEEEAPVVLTAARRGSAWRLVATSGAGGERSARHPAAARRCGRFPRFNGEYRVGRDRGRTTRIHHRRPVTNRGLARRKAAKRRQGLNSRRWEYIWGRESVRAGWGEHQEGVTATSGSEWQCASRRRQGIGAASIAFGGYRATA